MAAKIYTLTDRQLAAVKTLNPYHVGIKVSEEKSELYIEFLTGSLLKTIYIGPADIEIKPKMTYTGIHLPSREEWVILGVKKNEVCAAGWPPSIGKLSECIILEERGLRTEEEEKHIAKQFGGNWN